MMLNIFRWKIAWRLALLVLVPLVAFFFSGYTKVSQDIKDLGTTAGMQGTAEFIRQSSLLLDQLQKERGKTGLFAKEIVSLPALEEQRSLSRKSSAVYLELIDQIALSADKKEEKKKLALQALEALDGLRSKATDAAACAAAVPEYTAKIADLIKVEGATIDVPTTGGIGKTFTAIVLLETAKESAGQLRALASGLAALDQPISEKDLVKMAQLKSGMEVTLSSPALSIKPATREKLVAFRESNGWKEVSRMLSVLTGKSHEGHFGLDANAVFDAISAQVEDIGSLVTQELDLAGPRVKELHDQAEMQKIWTLLLFAVAFLVTGFLAIALGRGILGDLRRVCHFASKLMHGDLSTRLQMGRPVNCSAAKKCGEKSCPSFGKTSLCWTEAGSFSARPTCPRAKRGEDCRTCNLYGVNVRNEMEEVGAALNGMADELLVKTNVAKEIAAGNLAVRNPATSEQDVLGVALCDMVRSLREMIGQIQESGTQIDTGAAHIAASSQSLSQGAMEQAASLEEISGSAAQISAGVTHNAENATQASVLTKASRQVAESTVQKMEATAAAMTEINTSSSQIAKIIKVIDDIAFQTNLLALNAAVEAARAGRHGKGFAVVAEEVRNLAGRSAKAAKETAELIEGSGKKVTHGMQSIQETLASFREIVQSSIKASDLVGEISSSFNEQARDMGQIDEGIKQIEQVTQQSTASAEQTAAAAEELSGQAAELKRLVAHFRLEGQVESTETQQHDSAATPSSSTSLSRMTESGSSEPELIRWSPDLSVGVQRFDEQHRQLVTLINRLFNALREGRGDTVCVPILEELAAYTQNHFAAEEHQMSVHNYPDQENHKKAHADLLQRVVSFQEELKTGRSMLSIDLMNFLKSWLINHIQGTDKHYGPFFRGRGME